MGGSSGIPPIVETKMTTNTVDVLSPKTKTISLTFGTYTIQPLTLRQIFRAIILLKEMSTSVRGAKDEKEMLMNFVMATDAKRGEAVSVLLNTVEPLLDELYLADVAEIVAAVCEVNDFNKLASHFQTAMASLKTMKTISPLPLER